MQLSDAIIAQPISTSCISAVKSVFLFCVFVVLCYCGVVWYFPQYSITIISCVMYALCSTVQQPKCGSMCAFIYSYNYK